MELTVSSQRFLLHQVLQSTLMSRVTRATIGFHSQPSLPSKAGDVPGPTAKKIPLRRLRYNATGIHSSLAVTASRNSRPGVVHP